MMSKEQLVQTSAILRDQGLEALAFKFELAAMSPPYELRLNQDELAQLDRMTLPGGISAGIHSLVMRYNNDRTKE